MPFEALFASDSEIVPSADRAVMREACTYRGELIDDSGAASATRCM